MSRELTYAKAGVDRKLRKKSKELLKGFEGTYIHSLYGVIRLPFGNLISMDSEGNTFQDHKIEGIGTKVLIAQLADKYDTIGIDAVAMAVNDVIRSGAKPFSIADNIDVQKSDPYLVSEWGKGLVAGAHLAEAPIIDGEIADVTALIKGVKEGKGFHIVCSCVGYVEKEDIIYGKVDPRDVVIGLRSSGLHSNGISLARKVLFKEWGGYYDDPFVKLDCLDKELVLETLEPTKIYSRVVLRANKEYHLKAAVHVTGDAYLKFGKLMEVSPKVGFSFTQLRPQPIFSLIQETAKELGWYIKNEEMLKTFNLGCGFAVVTEKEKEDGVLDIFEKEGIEAWRIGVVNDSGEITARYRGRKYRLK
jgi:phosphoribosylformylglycinamidine cyclo-ligase